MMGHGPDPTQRGTAHCGDHWCPLRKKHAHKRSCHIELPLGPPRDVEPWEETENGGRNWKRQGERPAVDGGPGQAEPRWVCSGPTVLEANLTFSLTGLRSGVTVKTLTSTGRKEIGVWQLQAMAGPPPSAHRPPTSVLGPVHRLVGLDEHGGSPAVHSH